MLIVAGPTGSGKSALALDVASAFDGVVINADSAQVYRELRILTARPSPDDEARAPHRLYGVLSAAERCSAGRWLEMADAAIGEARSAGRLPVVVGGTGLYLKVVTKGLAPVPAVPAGVRAEATALWAKLGGEAFRAMLAERDPQAAAKLPAGDRQRLLRAWEVVRATGCPLSEWQKAAREGKGPENSAATLVLSPPRETLYPALDARFLRMLERGALQEVEALVAMHLDPSLPAMKAVGVRELAAHLRGETTLATATTEAQQATRRFAKRQMTWLRHQVAADAVFFEQYSERIKKEIFSFIRREVLTRAR
ncbi:tRNA dimethylallyltransferase [uncultured Defluviicoccus sp.]|uniref:tRNA dimethylallyltransferase n=1 Tax=metagenome TaxID=256318 RepID=A0A380TIC4_9ZZZZ|nr:tRNA dimethylallyltransferase [uncultured Defluviicoccus sp.]